MTSIGFIGLGTMGRPMAANLIKAGFQVALNRVKASSQDLVELGGKPVDSAKALAKDSEVIILMLPDTPDVEAVLFGKNGVAEGLSPGKLVIDMSSISPVATRSFAERVRALGCNYLDAPVSGGEIGARDAKLTIMVGGEQSVFDEALPIFQKLGTNITRVGPNGDGQMAKVANQMIVAANIAAVGEAFTLARQAGTDLTLLRQALLGGFASSRVLEVHGQRMIDETFKPGFKMRLHRKDLGLALDAARELAVALPGTSSTMQLMNAAVAGDMGEQDHSALYRVLSKISARGQS